MYIKLYRLFQVYIPIFISPIGFSLCTVSYGMLKPTHEFVCLALGKIDCRLNMFLVSGEL